MLFVIQRQVWMCWRRVTLCLKTAPDLGLSVVHPSSFCPTASLKNRQLSSMSFTATVTWLCQLAEGSVLAICNCAHVDGDVLNVSSGLLCVCIETEQPWCRLVSRGGTFSEICLIKITWDLSRFLGCVSVLFVTFKKKNL